MNNASPVIPPRRRKNSDLPHFDGLDVDALRQIARDQHAQILELLNPKGDAKKIHRR